MDKGNENKISEFVRKIKDGTIQFVVSQHPSGNKYHKYGSLKALDELVDSASPEDRIKAARMGYGLDKLMDDDNDSVLQAVWEFWQPDDEEENNTTNQIS